MGRKMWNKTSVTWDWKISGLGTSVHNDGHFDPNLYDPMVYGSGEGKIHKLYSMSIVSLPHERDGDRQGQVELDIKRTGRTYGETTPHSKAIVKYLKRALERLSKEGHGQIIKYLPRVTPPKTKSWTDTKFLVDFVMPNGEQFCDFAIEIGRAVFVGLGIHDEHGWHLADFSHKRETFVTLDGSWITFENWLRVSHTLPIQDSENRLF